MVYGRLCALFMLLGWVLCLRPVLGSEGKPGAQKTQKTQKQLEEAKQLADEATKLYQAGQHVPAIPLCAKALTLRQEALGPRHPEVASSLDNLAVLYRAIGQHAKAEPLLREALSIRKEVLGPRHLESARSLYELGDLYDDMGQPLKAEPLIQEALVIRKEALGPRHPEVATLLHLLGVLYDGLGEYAKVEPLYQEALAINKEALGSRHPKVAVLLANIGGLYVKMGLYAKAEPLLLQALAIHKEALGPRAGKVSRALNNLAILYEVMGLHGKAEPLFQEALAIGKEAVGPRHPDVADVANNLGLLYRETGQYAKAEPLILEALVIRQEALGPRHPNVAQSLNNLGLLYDRMAEYTKAEPLLWQALAIRKEVQGPRNPVAATTLGNLGNLYVDMGQYTKAETVHQEALAILVEALGARHPEVAVLLRNQAVLHLARQDLERGLLLFKQNIDIDEQFLRTIWTESRLTPLLGKLRELDDEIYSLLTQHQGRPDVQRLALTVALLRKGRSAAEGLATQRAIQQSLTEPQDRTLFARLTTARSQLASLYLKEPSSVPEYGKTLTALEIEGDGLEQELAQHSAAFHSLQFPGPDGIVASVAQAIPKDAALAEWLVFRPRHFSAKGQEPRWGSPRYLAMVLFPDQHIRVVDLGEVLPIDQAIEALQEQLSNRRPDYLAAAQRLHHLILAPVQLALEGRTNLLVSPDGALNLVPLWALHDGKQFVLDSYRITYLTSGRDLLRPAAVAPQALSMTVLANPEFRPAAAPGQPAVAVAAVSRAAFLQQLSHVPPLPGTGVEALAIQKLFPQARLLTGREATEKALRTLQAPAVLHIATHGVFWDDHAVPLYDAAYQPGRTLKVVTAPSVPGKEGPTPINPLARSALLLAGVEALGQPGPPTPDDNDGLMTALEVSGLNLWGTELVVLSACDTGRGAVQLGQGVYGLRRAFFNAGAETLVSSLWPVSDEATQGLMGSYYRNLLAGQGRVEAMRQAAMAVRAQQPHPYYWAPFVVLGKGEPLHGVPTRH